MIPTCFIRDPKSPQINGICERFHKTVLNEFYRVAFRKKVYRSIDELHACKSSLQGSSGRLAQQQAPHLSVAAYPPSS
jgi:hypothetical protein